MTRKIDNRHKDIGGKARARARYHMMAYRVNNCHLPKNKCYKGVKILISKEDFIKWFMANDFKGCSVDRIDPKGHYEKGNIQMIPTWINVGKDKLMVKDRKKLCVKCKNYVDFEDMVKSSARLILGLDSICKRCERERTRGRSKSAVLNNQLRVS